MNVLPAAPLVSTRSAGALAARVDIDFDDLDAIDAIVQAIALRHGWWERSSPAVRTFGRKSPDRQPLARMMYSVAGATRPAAVVDIVETVPVGSDAVVEPYRSEWLCAYPFGHDSALPGMSVLLDRHPEAEVIRYRPGQRCTLRIGDRFVKTFADDRGRQLHDEAVDLWRASSCGEVGFSVAEPLGFDPATVSQWQGLVPGQPVTADLGSACGPDLARRLGHALGTLAVSTIAPATVTGRDWQLARSERYVRRIGVLRPDLQDEAMALLTDLRRSFAAIGPIRHVVLHGSPHPHQWLHADPLATHLRAGLTAEGSGGRDGGIGLVDFDRLAFGEPELDLATFTTEVELGSGDTATLACINTAFISAYEEVVGPINGELLRLYEANKRLALAMTAATTLKPGAWPKVARRIQRARALLTSTA